MMPRVPDPSNIISMFGQPVPWNDPRAYRPETLEQIRARLNGKPRHVRVSWFAELREDWLGFWSDVAEAPEHHALFGGLVFIASCVVIYGSSWLIVHTVLS